MYQWFSFYNNQTGIKNVPYFSIKFSNTYVASHEKVNSGHIFFFLCSCTCWSFVKNTILDDRLETFLVDVFLVDEIRWLHSKSANFIEIHRFMWNLQILFTVGSVDLQPWIHSKSADSVDFNEIQIYLSGTGKHRITKYHRAACKGNPQCIFASICQMGSKRF